MFPLLLLAFLLASGVLNAALTRIEVIERSGVLNGASSGNAGPYERIIARAYFAADPANAANGAIADLRLAPKNEAGLVEYSSDLYVLKPADPAKGNGTALLEISNRGGKGLLPLFDYGSASRDPRLDSDFGDRFLLEQGYTLVWVGWEFDVPPGSDLLHLYAPVAGRPQTLTGLVRSEFIPDARTTVMPLGDRAQIGYAVADPNDPANQLTVRDTPLGSRRLLPRSAWTFPDPRHVALQSGFEPGRIYEAIYRAKDPAVAGLGAAAVRDMVSFLKYGGASTLLADQRLFLKRALGVGVSQSGRFLRSFLHDGFNADEKGRRVFDGIWAIVAGAGQGSFNERFAQPSRDGHPFLNMFYPVDVPPFTDLDGLLAAEQQTGAVPKIFYSNGSYEYWGRAASLIHTTPDGKQDAPLAPDTRIYFIAGTQHGPGSFPLRRSHSVALLNPNDHRPMLRALLTALQNWVKDGIEPPPSAYPLIRRNQLGSIETVRVPGRPDHKHEARRLDFSKMPPGVGDPYPTLVPQVDDDGNETGGVRMPEVDVPLGVYTGWNLRDGSQGARGEYLNMAGSFFPFSAEKIRQRYGTKPEYLARVDAAGRKLTEQRLLLPRDLPRIRERASQLWDYVLPSN